MNPDQPVPTQSNNSLAERLGRWWHSLNGPMRSLATLAMAVGLLLLGLGLYAALNPKQDQPATDTTTQVSPATADVSITKDRLDPATITIDAGTQLTWTNNDSKPHQIAADPHPLENSIEGFDSETVLQPGDSMSFTFETPGTYSVHDHLDYLEDAYHGVVIVK